jgi:hypothetical protein
MVASRGSGSRTCSTTGCTTAEAEGAALQEENGEGEANRDADLPGKKDNSRGITVKMA